MTQTQNALQQAISGYGGSTLTAKPATTIGQILDLYVVHLIVSLIFIAGGIILLDRYSLTTKASGWNDLFYSLGGITLLINFGFCVGLFIAWIWKQATVLSRQDDSIHWLHALSISAAAFAGIWGILALILTFGATLANDTPDNLEVAGYFMTLFGVVFSIYLAIRYLAGLAGATSAVTSGFQVPTNLSTSDFLAAMRSASSNSAFSQPIFGGGGGAAAFGGIDLSGLQPSSMSSMPPTQHAGGGGGCGSPQMMGNGCPMVILPQMMMQQPQTTCAPDPNAIHIS